MKNEELIELYDSRRAAGKGRVSMEMQDLADIIIRLGAGAGAQPASAPVAEDAVEALALRAITAHFNTFIAACMTEDGKPRAPTTGQLAAARACMPKSQSTAFNAALSTPEIENAATVGQWKDGHA